MNLKAALKIPKSIRDIEDAFSKELVELWDSRDLEGKVYWYEKGEKPVCYLLVQEQGYLNTIRGFYTVPEARGKGLGSSILETVCKLYESMGAHAMIVNITEGAEKVYERANFTILGKRRDFPDQSIAFRGVMTDSEERDLAKKLK